MNPYHPGSLEEQVGELRSRVRRLEELLRSRGFVQEDEAAAFQVQRATRAVPPFPPPAAVVQTEFTQPVAAPPPTPPNFGVEHPAAPDDERSLESRIGSQWFNRIGILAVMIGMAWFLKLAIDNHWIGPLGRVLIGLVAGAALIAWSERFRSRGYTAFAYSLKAVGSGILYLSLWAAFSLFHLMPAAAAFVAMIAVTAFNGFMAWIQDAELLALYAIVGALSTPLLVSTGENHQITLFSYLLLLDIAVLVLVVLRPWSRLLFLAFVGTVIFFAGWWATFYSEWEFARTAFFLSCFFLIFAFAPRLVQVDIEESNSSAWDKLALILLPVANAALGFLGFYALFESKDADWAGPWLAVAFAAFYLLLLRLPARGRLRLSPAVLSSLHLAAAVVFLTIVIPLKAHGRWLTIGWLVEGAALLWVASRIRSTLLRVLSLLCLLLGLMALLVENPIASATPIFNERFGTYCVAIAVFAFVAWLARNTQPTADHEHILRWPALAAASLLLINALILLALSLEIHSYWWHLQYGVGAAQYRNYGIHVYGQYPMINYAMYAQFSYSALFMLYGALLLAAGFWRRSGFLRWQALVLLAVAIAKVFLVDISELSQGYRILSFLGLGTLLLAVSFIYQRDWLDLRGHGRRAA